MRQILGFTATEWDVHVRDTVVLIIYVSHLPFKHPPLFVVIGVLSQYKNGLSRYGDFHYKEL